MWLTLTLDGREVCDPTFDSIFAFVAAVVYIVKPGGRELREVRLRKTWPISVGSFY